MSRNCTDDITMDDLKSMKGQKVVYLNARSIYSHISELQVEFDKSNYTALCFSETWLHRKLSSGLVTIESFKLIRLDRKSDKRGGGVAIYIRDGVEYELMQGHWNVSDPNIEIPTVKVIRNFQRNLYISIVYLPPKADVVKSIEFLDVLCNQIPMKTCDWLMGGDFNVNLEEKEKRSRTCRLMDNFAKRNTLTQLIKTGTRKGKSSYSLIDHIYTNCIEKILHSGKIAYKMTDHDLTYAVIKKNIPKKEKITFKCRTLKNYNTALLSDWLSHSDWSTYYSETDPEKLWQILHRTYFEGVDILAAEIEINCKEKETWVSNELLELIRDRDKLKSVSDASEDNLSFNKFKEKRAECKRRIMKDKRDFIQNYLNITKEDPRKYWQKINELFPHGKKAGKTSEPEIIILKNDENKEITKEDVPDFINDFFTSIGPNLSSKIKIDNRTYITACKKPCGDQAMLEWTKILDIEVLKVVKDLDIHKGSNIEGLNSKLLKDCLLGSINEVTYLLNMVSKTGNVPQCWKEATVVPIFKGGDRNGMINELIHV